MAVIMIVEDEALIREYTELMINDWGYTTLSASDVEEALALLHSSQHIDALFTDIRLKKAVQGGFEVAHRAIQVRPTLRVLYATGGIVTTKTKEMFVEGAYFLQKPYTADTLQKSLGELLAE